MKKTYAIIKLKFISPLHLSKGKGDYASSFNILHSDTLKSALFSAAIDMGLDVGQNAQSVEASGYGKNSFLEGFTLSSAFPFYGDEYFFPKPNSVFHQVQANGKIEKKGQKDIAFIGKSLFEEILKGEKTQSINGDIQFLNSIDKNTQLFPFGNLEHQAQNAYEKGIFASVILTKENLQKEPFILAKELMMRVYVPRLADTEDANPYNVERLYFPENGGLYFFLDVKNEAARQNIYNALEFLGENGIGTDKNTGNGQFTFSQTTMDLDIPETSDYRINLSLLCPHKDEVNKISLDKSAYNLIKRGGYIANPQDNPDLMSYRKKSVYMFEEGSILHSNAPLEGTLLDLSPEVFSVDEHPIWRDGTAFSLPINPIWHD